MTSPSRYYDRLGEAGIDYAILYPTVGLQLGHLADDDRRVELCRLYNEYMADQYSPDRDRFAMAAVVPMDSPGEAVEAMTHAVGLGAQVALIPSYVRRQLRVAGPAAWPTPEAGTVEWIDTYGLDSLYDYDPVWAKAIDLGLPLAAHSVGMGFTDRSSISNFVYNHIGHFGAVGEALAKSLFLGGVTCRFPRLRVALLEGGVVSGLRLFSDLVGHWHKRGGHALDRLNPSNIDRQLLTRLLTERDPAMGRYAAEDIVAVWGGDDDRRDDFAATSVRSEQDLRDLYCPNFYWGCEADDPFVGLAFDHRLTPLGGESQQSWVRTWAIGMCPSSPRRSQRRTSWWNAASWTPRCSGSLSSPTRSGVTPLSTGVSSGARPWRARWRKCWPLTLFPEAGRRSGSR